jgi:hypothetical protein
MHCISCRGSAASEDGDMAGCTTWHRILDAIERLQAKAPVH